MWDNHITYITSTFCRTIGIIRLQCFYLPISMNTLLYKSIFFHLINYGILVYNTTTNENSPKFTVFQKQVIRLCCNLPYLSYTVDGFEKFDIVPIIYMFNYKLCRCFILGLFSNDDALSMFAGLKQNIGVYKTCAPEPWNVNKFRQKLQILLSLKGKSPLHAFTQTVA